MPQFDQLDGLPILYIHPNIQLLVLLFFPHFIDLSAYKVTNQIVHLCSIKERALETKTRTVLLVRKQWRMHRRGKERGSIGALGCDP